MQITFTVRKIEEYLNVTLKIPRITYIIYIEIRILNFTKCLQHLSTAGTRRMFHHTSAVKLFDLLQALVCHRAADGPTVYSLVEVFMFINLRIPRYKS